MNTDIMVGDIIQLNDKNGEWSGCLLIVDSVNNFGVVAGMRVPYQGYTYLRLRYGKFTKVGKSIRTPEFNSTEY